MPLSFRQLVLHLRFGAAAYDFPGLQRVHSSLALDNPFLFED